MGAWEAEVNGFRIRLDLTETPSPGPGLSVLESNLIARGSGTLTSLSNGVSVDLRAFGSNRSDPQTGIQIVHLNFFEESSLRSYGQVTGAIHDARLVGLVTDSRDFGPFVNLDLTVVFSRP